MDPANNEYVIKVKDVLYIILKKLWLMIIVGLVAGAGLFYINFSKVETVKSSDVLDISKKINSGESDAKYLLRAQSIERARIISELIDDDSIQIEKERIYMSESITMQIDPDNTYISAAQFSLTIENNDVNGIESVLFSAYEREIRYGDYLDQYAEEIGSKPEYIRELISFSTGNSTTTVINIENNENMAGSLYVYVFGPSREFVDETIDLVVAEIQSIHNELKSSIAPHSLSLVGFQKYCRVDSGVRDLQRGHTERIYSLQTEINTYNNTLESISKDLELSDKAVLLNYLKTHERVEISGIPTEYSETVTNHKAKIVPNLKWLGIGFGAGALLIAVFVAIGYVFGKKILTQAQFFGLFRYIKRIGVMKPLGKRSKFIRFIDVKTEDDTKVSAEKCNGLISANYCNLTKDLNKVLITGTGDEKAMGDAVKALGLKGDFKPDIFNNPEVLKVVPDYDGIVLIEQRKKSLKPVVENEINLLSNGGTKIIGAIII